MPVTVRVDDRSWKRFHKRFPAYLDMRRAELMHEVGTAIDHDIIANIRTQGGKFGAPWAPMSKWTMAKKGPHHQLLEHAIPFFKFRASKDKVQVFFDGRAAGWSIEEHHDGVTIPPSGQRVTLSLLFPQALGLKSRQISFVSLAPSEIPARRIWPTELYARKRVTSIAERWWQQTMAGVPK